MRVGLASTLRYGSPAFIIPGAQKCGTSALAAYLDRHSGIRLATTKEPDFFLRDARYHGGGLEGYRKYFPKRRLFRKELFFEASAGYLFHPPVAARMAAFDPALRFVVMVREPASRAYSAWNMYRRLLSVPSERARFEGWLVDHNPRDRAAGSALLARSRVPSFVETVEDELDSIARHGPSWTLPAVVAGGLYAPQLERFLECFPPEHFMLLEDRDLTARPAETLNEVLAFLGLPAHDWGDAFPKVFAGEYDEPADGATLQALRDFYAPHNERLFEIGGRTFEWDSDSSLA